MKQRESTKLNEKNKVCTILPAPFTTLSSIRPNNLCRLHHKHYFDWKMCFFPLFVVAFLTTQRNGTLSISYSIPCKGHQVSNTGGIQVFSKGQEISLVCVHNFCVTGERARRGNRRLCHIQSLIS